MAWQLVLIQPNIRVFLDLTSIFAVRSIASSYEIVWWVPSGWRRRGRTTRSSVRWRLNFSEPIAHAFFTERMVRRSSDTVTSMSSQSDPQTEQTTSGMTTGVGIHSFPGMVPYVIAYRVGNSRHYQTPFL
jgi:hypothetical protein